jgi:hypothetical protein
MAQRGRSSKNKNQQKRLIELNQMITLFILTRVVETIVAAVDSIWDAGGQKKKIVGASKCCCCPSSVPTVSEAFWGETPPGKGSQNAFSAPIVSYYRKGAFGPTRKNGGGSLPPPTHNFSSSRFKFIVARRSR